MDILEAEEILKNFIEYAELDNTESRAIETVLEELHTLRKQANSVFDRGYIHKDKIREKINELIDKDRKARSATTRLGIQGGILALQELLEEE